MLKTLRTKRNFFRDTASLAALEFAIVLPLMLILLAGVYDLSEAAIVRAEVYNAAESMAASASSLAVQSDNSTALTYAQVQQVESTIWALVPTLRDGQQVGTPMSVTMSSVFFFPTLTNSCGFGTTTPCQYNADVAWGVTYAGGDSGATFVPEVPNADCNQIFSTPSQDQVTPSTALNGTQNILEFKTLNLTTTSGGTTALPDGDPANEAGVAPILAVTIQFTYRPLFNLFLLQPYTFWVDGYWPVRSTKATAPRTVISGTNVIIVPPLSNQYTTLVGTPGVNGGLPTLQGTPTPSTTYYCTNQNVSPSAVSAPVS
jgi:Flp pilus assembly protein TadG